MLRLIVYCSLFVFAFSSCASNRKENFAFRREMSIQLIDVSDQYFQIIFHNGTGEDYVINGISGPGYVQSSVQYKILGISDGGPKSKGSGMPIILDANKYRVNLMSGATYGFVIDKSEFIQINGLRGGCYSIAVTYSPPSVGYTLGVLTSDEEKICFLN